MTGFPFGRVVMPINRPAPNGLFFPRWPDGATQIAGAAAAATAASAVLATAGGGAPGAVGNFRLINQGGPTNNTSRAGGSVSNIQAVYWEAPSGGTTPDSYVIQRGIDNGAYSDLATVSHTGATSYVYVDSTATNTYNASNIGEDGGSPITTGPTTVYSYRVLAIAATVRGPAPTQCKFMFYEGATPPAWSSIVAYLVGARVSSAGNNYYCIVANTNQTPASNPSSWTSLGATGNNCNGPSFDLSFGLTSNNLAHARTGGTDCVAVASGPGAGIQLAADSPLTWVFGGEVGAFCPPVASGFFTIDVTPSRTGMALNFAILTRGPPGDVFPHKVVNLLSYGPATVAGVKGTYKVPLGDVMFGVTQATASISGGVMNVTAIASGPGIDCVSWITGPNITTPTWISATPSQNGTGNYTVTGQASAASGPVTIHRTSFYKFQVVMADAANGESIEYDNHGVVLS